MEQRSRLEISDRTALDLESKVLDPKITEASDALDLAVDSTDVLGPFVDGILPATRGNSSSNSRELQVDREHDADFPHKFRNTGKAAEEADEAAAAAAEGEDEAGGSSSRNNKPTSCSRSSTFSERSVESCDSFLSAESKLEPDAEREELHQMFRTFDENGDGRISQQELGNTMRKLGFEMSDSELQGMVTVVDEDGDGHINFEEFMTLYSSLYWEEAHGRGDHGGDHGNSDEDELLEAFSVFDKNNDGYISVTELQSVLSSLGLKEGAKMSDCHKMISAVDKDGDGRVNFAEFKQMMSSNNLLKRS